MVMNLAWSLKASVRIQVGYDNGQPTQLFIVPCRLAEMKRKPRMSTVTQRRSTLSLTIPRSNNFEMMTMMEELELRNNTTMIVSHLSCSLLCSFLVFHRSRPGTVSPHGGTTRKLIITSFAATSLPTLCNTCWKSDYKVLLYWKIEANLIL